MTKSDRKCERGLRFATVGDSMSDYDLHARSDRLPRASVSGGAPARGAVAEGARRREMRMAQLQSQTITPGSARLRLRGLCRVRRLVDGK